MAKKEFTYRGLKLEQLQKMSIKEFAQLCTSRARRSLLRGLSSEQKNLLRKLEKKDKVKTHAREMVIIPQMVGKSVQLHNGKGYVPITITEEMVGYKLGEFASTRKIARHSSPGVSGKKGAKVGK